MASTVIAAFDEFMRDKINLSSAESDLAKKSRDWLMDRIHEFPNKYSTFPALNNGKDIFFGSFERKTKKRPLDDIDIMVCMDAQTATYTQLGDTVYIETRNENSPLYNLRHDDNYNINSRRVINKFVSVLTNVAQYDKAGISRRGEAATLNLKTYPWTFDIVPCFHTAVDENGRQFYIIPDGNGNWQRTDPRIDRAKVQRIVLAKGIKVLSVIRLVKYWNRRPTMPSLPSYMLENMILNYYEMNECTDYFDWEFRDIVGYIRNVIYYIIPDPKGFQGDLNKVEFSDRVMVALRCESDHKKSIEAINFESNKDMNKSIAKWSEIFGQEFPTYG